jgi:hypothetical protein
MNPQKGRFLTLDTNEGYSGVPATLHKYLYGDADPVDESDPSGHAGIIEIGILAQLAHPVVKDSPLRPRKPCESAMPPPPPSTNGWFGRVLQALILTEANRRPSPLQMPNLCNEGDYCILEQAGPNPYAPGGGQRAGQFEREFGSKCAALAVPGGPTPYATCGHAAGYFGAAEYCDCCEHCEGR